MKRIYIIFLVMALSILTFGYASSSLSGEYYYYKPYFMDRAQLEKSVKMVDSPREMVDPGKIYVKGDRIFISERYKGIHVIDNSNPSNPVPVAFIVAPGCVDMAIKGDIIYMDNAVDLVAFDLVRKAETERIKNILPEPLPPNGRNYYYSRPKDMILVGWSKTSSPPSYY